MLYPHPTGRWTLQVTGIIKERGFTDSHGRQIHVSLIGVATDADGLATLTNVARLALTDKLSDVLPIDYHGFNRDALGYRFDADAWDVILPNLTASDRDSAGAAVPAGELALSLAIPETEAARHEIARHLTQLAASGYIEQVTGRPLLIRTTLLEETDLRAIKPWRATSSQLNRQVAVPAPPLRVRVPPGADRQPPRPHPSSVMRRRILLVCAFLLGMGAVALAYVIIRWLTR